MARHRRRLGATGACRLHAGTIRILYEVDDEAAVISSSTSRPSPEPVGGAEGIRGVVSRIPFP